MVVPDRMPHGASRGQAIRLPSLGEWFLEPRWIYLFKKTEGEGKNTIWKRYVKMDQEKMQKKKKRTCGPLKGPDPNNNQPKLFLQPEHSAQEQQKQQQRRATTKATTATRSNNSNAQQQQKKSSC